jgi:hypothetical protein
MLNSYPKDYWSPIITISNSFGKLVWIVALIDHATQSTSLAKHTFKTSNIVYIIEHCNCVARAKAH